MEDALLLRARTFLARRKGSQKATRDARAFLHGIACARIGSR